MYYLKLTPTARGKWLDFLANDANLGHAKRRLSGVDVEAHVNAGMASTRATIARVKNDIGELVPSIILEIGCSAGLNCLALQEAFPEAMVIGVEPELKALAAAESLKSCWPGKWPHFVHGVGESIALGDRSVDLVICHTVIEHVRNVPSVVREIARVLTPSGFAHLEAPNYLWPYEPHLEIWTIPKFGKQFVGICAHLQGRSAMLPFLEHLQFVTPFQLEPLFTEFGLAWHNRTGDKIRAVMAGKGDVRKYRAISRMLGLLGHAGVAERIAQTVLAVGVYPSVLYTLRRT